MSRVGPVNPNESSFVNNFWGPTDSGFRTIQTRMKHSLKTLQELLDYYQERIIIEKEFNKRLDKLNHKISMGTNETGTLKKSLDKLAYENVQMTKHTAKFIKSVTQINYDNLHDFYNIYHKKVSKIDHHMSKIIAKRNDCAKQLDATKSKFQEDCVSIKSLRLCVQTTWGKELEKHEAKLSKVSQSINNSKKAYQVALAQYKELNDIYVQDWAIALQDFYKLEVERIQLLKVNCFNFCNNVATLCVDNDSSVDMARSVFAKIQPPQDLQDFGLTHGTGDKIYNVPEFVDYMNGYDDDESKAKNNFHIANYETPDYQPILSRSYSTYSHASSGSPHHQTHKNHHTQSSIPSAPLPSSVNTPSKPSYHNSNISSSLMKELPPVELPPPSSQPPYSPPKTPSPTRKAPPPTGIAINGSIQSGYLPIKPAPASVYSSSPDDKTDVFSLRNKNDDELARSNGSSNYSNPTNYSSSNYSNGEKHWASPRRKEKQLNQFQEQINLKSKELPFPNSNTPKPEQTPNKSVPIMKDFSIDFIAKALEDLNSGGNGDVSQYRRSVRRARAEEGRAQSEYGANSSPKSPFRSASDYVDDHDEVATRYGSINFTSPVQQSKPKTQGRPKSMLEPYSTPQAQKQRPRSMLDPYEPFVDHNDSASTCIVKSSDKPRRTLSKSPTKSYTNLRAMIDQPPETTPVLGKPYVMKATARYTYKPQHHGELFFKKGWNMYIIHKQEDNWFFCELGANCNENAGMVGLVPGNYLVEGHDIF